MQIDSDPFSNHHTVNYFLNFVVYIKIDVS